jgi:transcriptional regulator with XRE-family HTH domain
MTAIAEGPAEDANRVSRPWRSGNAGPLRRKDAMIGLERQQTLGQVIRARRLALGLSQEALADRVAARGDEAFRQSDVSRLERGAVALPRRPRLEHLAAALDLPLGELLALSGWSGAVAAFTPINSHDVIAPAQRPSATPALHLPLPSLGIDVGRVGSFELRSIIARAEETKQRSADILRRCEVTRVLYDQPWLRQIPATRAKTTGRGGPLAS